MIRRVLLSLLAVLLVAPAAAAQSLKGIQSEFSAIGDAVIPATVIVRSPRAPPGAGSSGVIVTPDGYILSDGDATLTGVEQKPDGTRVKTHGTDAVVRLPAPDHRLFKAVVVKRDPETDTTLLHIVDSPEDLPFVPIGISDRLRIGAFLVVVGNSFGTGQEGEPALSMGVTTALAPRTEPTGGRFDRIYTSASVTPGSNGGPVVDLTGHVVGIVSTFESDATSPFRALGIVNPVDRIRIRYAGVPDYSKVFSIPAETELRTDDASVLEDAFEILARRAAPSLVSLVVDRGDEKVTKQVAVPRGHQLAVVTVERYPGPYSALVLSRDGYLLTSSENLWGGEKIRSITACFADGRKLPAKLLGRDRFRGVALLRVKADDLVPLPRAGPDDIQVGRFAIALGAPATGKTPLLTFGIVSDLHRLDPSFDAIQSDAGMNDAMAGGALLTLDGKLLGMSFLERIEIQEQHGRNSGIGFAIPSATVDAALPDLKQGKSALPGFLGVRFGLAPGGLAVAVVVPSGPAAKCGIEKGDVIIGFDDRAVSDFAGPQEIGKYLQTLRAGQALSLTVKRGADTKTIDLVLGAVPGD